MDNDKKMDRQDFLKHTGAGLCACAAMFCPGIECITHAVEDPKPEAPINEKVEHAQRWVKRFFDTLDAQLDEPARKKLMEANGKNCYVQSHTPPKQHIALDKLVQRMQDRNGKENCRMDGNTVYYNYVQNPRGLRVADGYCLCPIVEKGPEGLSGTFCYCSAGYVREMFESLTGEKATVEILESIKRGGKGCKFKVTFVER
jgi:hypothetical protein